MIEEQGNHAGVAVAGGHVEGCFPALFDVMGQIEYRVGIESGVYARVGAGAGVEEEGCFEEGEIGVNGGGSVEEGESAALPGVAGVESVGDHGDKRFDVGVIGGVKRAGGGPVDIDTVIDQVAVDAWIGTREVVTEG